MVNLGVIRQVSADLGKMSRFDALEVDPYP